MTAEEFVGRLEGVAKTASGWSARCPAHEDKRASLGVKEASNGKVLVNCHAGCGFTDIVTAMGLQPGDLFPAKPHTNGIHPAPRKVVATYRYLDAEGNLIAEKQRLEPKRFLWRHRGPSGDWIWQAPGKMPLYRLPDVMAAVRDGNTVWVFEGEKDADNAVKAGLLSSTSGPDGADPNGAKWLPAHTEALRGGHVVFVADADEKGRKFAQAVVAKLRPVVASLKVIETPRGKDFSDFVGAGGTAVQLMTIATEAPEWTPPNAVDPLPGNEEPERAEEADPTLEERLAERLFRETARPPMPEARFSLSGTPICTAGNLTAISAGVKSGKSAFVGAMITATLATPEKGADCLGLASSNNAGHALLHFDTEQSIYDHWALVDRAMRRAGIGTLPPWVRSYCLTGFTIADAKAAIALAVESALNDFGGIHAVLIDGVADLVADVNDAEESNGFVAHLHAEAIRWNCPIVGVLHLNPGTEKTRGHLGSQLERKAETNLRLEKDGEVIVVWSDKNRRAPILKDSGPRFRWSEAQQMHVSCETLGAERDNAKRAELRELAEEAFQATGKTALRWADLVAAIKDAGGAATASGARKKMDAMSDLGVITKTVGLWSLTR